MSGEPCFCTSCERERFAIWLNAAKRASTEEVRLALSREILENIALRHPWGTATSLMDVIQMLEIEEVCVATDVLERLVDDEESSIRLNPVMIGAERCLAREARDRIRAAQDLSSTIPETPRGGGEKNMTPERKAELDAYIARAKTTRSRVYAAIIEDRRLMFDAFGLAVKLDIGALEATAAIQRLIEDGMVGGDEYCQCWFSLNTGPNGECETCGKVFRLSERENKENQA